MRYRIKADGWLKLGARIFGKITHKRNVIKFLQMERGFPKAPIVVHPVYGMLVNVMGVWVDGEGMVYVFDEEKYDYIPLKVKFEDFFRII